MKSVFKYVNNCSETIEFILEPWAEEFKVSSGSEVVITGDYSYGDTFCQLQQDSDGVIFFAWEHSLVRIEIDGKDVTKTSNKVRF